MALDPLKTPYKPLTTQNPTVDTTFAKQQPNTANTSVTQPKRKRGRPQKQPSLRYMAQKEYQKLTESKSSTQTHQNPNPTQPDQTENPEYHTDINTVTAITDVCSSNTCSTDESVYKNQTEKLTQPEPQTDLIGESSISTRTQTEKVSSGDNTTLEQKVSQGLDKSVEKVSHTQKLSPSNRGGEKVSHVLPLYYDIKQLKSKTTLTLVTLFSVELTPAEIKLMLDHRDELELTHAEITALNLLQNMENDPESRKHYWKIMETMQKDKKQPTPVQPQTTTLLDEKLAQAQEAIFGEILEK